VITEKKLTIEIKSTTEAEQATELETNDHIFFKEGVCCLLPSFAEPKLLQLKM
jgi:hypothetical protein